MPDYSKGKIYTVRCRTDDTLIYVGCTIESLSVRFAKHKHDKQTSLYKYINNPENITEWSQWYIELFELCPCNCKEELCKREGEVIREIATINKYGYYLDAKDYYQTNKQQILDYRKEHYLNNIKHNAATMKEYYDINKEDILKKNKEYLKSNVDAVKEYRKQYTLDNKDKKKAYDKEYRAKKKLEKHK